MPTGAAGPVANEPLEISPTPTPPPPPQTIESAPPNMPPTSLCHHGYRTIFTVSLRPSTRDLKVGREDTGLGGNRTAADRREQPPPSRGANRTWRQGLARPPPARTDPNESGQYVPAATLQHASRRSHHHRSHDPFVTPPGSHAVATGPQARPSPDAAGQPPTTPPRSQRPCRRIEGTRGPQDAAAEPHRRQPSSIAVGQEGAPTLPPGARGKGRPPPPAPPGHAEAPPPSSSPEENQTSATKTPPANLSPETTLAISPLDELLPTVAPPPSPFFDPPYMKAGQVALRCFLGCGNAMGLEFEDDASYYLRLSITTPAIHLASPLYIIFHYSNRRLDAIIVAALLQSVLGGAAADFFVAHCSPLVYRFHVASARIAEIILAQSTLRSRAYAFSFLRTLPPLPPSPPHDATCMPLAHLLQIPEDLGLHFESVAWTQCRSLISQRPPNQPHGCRTYVRVIQFPFTLDAITTSLILVCLFGDTHHHFNVTDDGDSCFSFTVASPAVAALIASMGDFHKLGILLRFPWPVPTGCAPCSPSGTTMPSNGPMSSSPAADDPTLPPPASTTIVLSKERRQRPGISFFYHMLNVLRSCQLTPHANYTHHTHLF
ncbi:uncharacterized protein [Triticum aestivum]|uniref:uncharacterized protein n=1 Tax=Triticum aestivum TaxID=4565 RepID=UPI001D026CB7|nr:uncharacterized protein LOC123191870 [Triticum aestivum]